MIISHFDVVDTGSVSDIRVSDLSGDEGDRCCGLWAAAGRSGWGRRVWSGSTADGVVNVKTRCKPCSEHIWALWPQVRQRVRAGGVVPRWAPDLRCGGEVRGVPWVVAMGGHRHSELRECLLQVDLAVCAGRPDRHWAKLPFRRKWVTRNIINIGVLGMKAITATRPGRRFLEGSPVMCSSPELIRMFSQPPNADRLSVCTTARSGPCAQRWGRYLPERDAHRAKEVPAIAAQAGDLVVDPMCAVGTGLVVVQLARVLATCPASTARVITACAVPNDPDDDPIWQAMNLPSTDRLFDPMETTSQESDYRVLTLTKSSYRLLAAATEPVDEQRRSSSDPAIPLGPTSDSGLDCYPPSGLQD